MPKKYRLIMRTVEAIRVTPESAERAAMWAGGMVVDEYDAVDSTRKFTAMNIPTIAGMKRASEGDYIVKDQAGRVSVWKTRDFEAEYELAE